MEKNKVRLVIQLAGVALALLMVAIVFLPFATATKENREFLMKHPDAIYVQEISMTNAQAVSVSLFEYARLYGASVEIGYEKAQSIFGIVIIAAFAGMALLTVLFAAIRKPIPQIVFSALAMFIFWLNHVDFSMRGVIPSSRYNWGIANWLAFVVGVMLIAEAIVMIIHSKKRG